MKKLFVNRSGPLLLLVLVLAFGAVPVLAIFNVQDDNHIIDEGQTLTADDLDGTTTPGDDNDNCVLANDC